MDKKMHKTYVIEYCWYDGRSSVELTNVESKEDVMLYVKEHHRFTKKLYKKWYKTLKWLKTEKNPIKKENWAHLRVSEDDVFYDSDKNKYRPSRIHRISFPVQYRSDDYYSITCEEYYDIYEIIA